ncbi:MAG: secondary thiamine-phosphate synthase enzyme YjbQ [Solirubrobacteraceae bacterium]
MGIHSGLLRLTTDGGGEIVDLTAGVASVVRTASTPAGVVSVFVQGTTAAVTTMEYEPGAVIDLRRALERIAPADGESEHNRRNADDNGHAHVRAAIVGPGVSVPLVGGELALGRWQQIVLIDLDTRPRERTVLVHVVF